MSRSPYTSASWCAGALLLASLTGMSQAHAADFDARGQLDFSPDAALTYDFDQAPDAALMKGYVYQGRSYQQLDASRFEQDAAGLQGEGSLLIGGARQRAYLVMGEQWQQLHGRRVAITFWYKPRGTDIRADLSWASGDVSGFIEGTSFNIFKIAALTFHPTGRATSDGWIELGTDPFDYTLGGIDASWLTITDTQHVQYAGGNGQQGYPYDPDAEVLIDALEVIDLGPALVPDAVCNGQNQDQVCGAAGGCMMGRCVDATLIYGHAPGGQIGEQYLERRMFELQTFEGPRHGRTKLAEVGTILGALDPTDVKTYWREFTRAFELLIDGHGGPPSDSALFFYHPSGICLGPGVADLSPESASRDTMRPMVFSADAAFGPGARLQRGDVLTHIDDLDVWDWVAQNGDYFYYNGDPAGRRVISMLNIIQSTKRLGSKLTFERCARQDGLPCEPSEVLEIEVDFATEVGALIWGGTPPEDIYDYTNACDLRFERVVAAPVNAASYYFAGFKDAEDGVRHVLINGVPHPQERQGATWHNALNGALGSGPAHLVFDQRTGYGGYMEGVARAIGHFLDPANRVSTLFFPWVGQEIEGSLLDTFVQCAAWSRGGGTACGNFGAYTMQDLVNTGGSRSSRLAVLNGFDVSGNDYLSRFLAFRQAPTRIFGYGPAMGAYGQSCSFPRLLGETQSMRYQCHDSFFGKEDTNTWSGFESGTGVAPHQVVYQRQSDALRGEDTMINAAHEWLLTPEVMP